MLVMQLDVKIRRYKHTCVTGLLLLLRACLILRPQREVAATRVPQANLPDVLQMPSVAGVCPSRMVFAALSAVAKVKLVRLRPLSRTSAEADLCRQRLRHYPQHKQCCLFWTCATSLTYC